MGLLSWFRGLRRAPALQHANLPQRDDEVFSWAPGRSPWLPGGTYVGVSGWVSRVNRDEAMSVPAVKRGRDLICSTGALPLRVLDAQRQVVPNPLFAQIDRNVPNVVTLSQTIDDLVFESVAWWEITESDWAGFPRHARHLDVEAVSLHPPAGSLVQSLPSGLYPAGVVYVSGRAIDARNIIRFDSPNDPLLLSGARAIRRAIKLAQAGEMYADDPEARAYWTPRDPTAGDPGDESTIRGWIRRFIAARRAGSEAYIPAALERNVPSGPSAVDIQLAQLQQRSDLEIANILGIDPEDIGVNTTSRTYNNATDRRVDRLNTVLAPYMNAITDRLSLRDVVRRGQRVAWDLDDYLKADPATRWANYAIALDRQVISVGEVRAKEDYPDVPVESAPTPTGAAVPQQQNTRGIVTHFAEEERGDVFSFDVPLTFAVDTAKRTITGDVLPYNVIGENWSGKWKFEPGSIEWNRSAVSRVKLNHEHYGQAFAAATDLRNTSTALAGTFKVGRGAFADERLMSAEDGIQDGLSAEVKILEYTIDKTGDQRINVVTKARLTGVALTASPAFDDARVTKVAASRKELPVDPDQTQDTEPAEDSATAAFTAAVDRFTAAIAALAGQVPPEQRATIPVVAAVREPMIYSLNGLGPSFVRDAWTAKKGGFGKGPDEALSRLRKYAEQTEAVAQAFAERGVQFANAGNTTDQADIIPPGYRPDLYVGQIPQGRPLFDAFNVTRILLANATPFKVPYWVGSAGLSGDNSEGTGPSTGTITDHDYTTVTPTAQSGEFEITRELMDSANPAIDVIALNAMREEYAQDTEGKIADHLEDITDDGSPVMGTSDTSTEGCYVYAVTGTGNDLYIEGIRFAEGEYPGHRFLTPDRMLAGPTGYGALLKAIDDVGRPMFPFTTPVNAGGSSGRAGGSLLVDGMMVPNAWSMTSSYDDVVIANAVDVLTGESPMLTFRFEEKSGPEKIILDLWAYFAVQTLRPAGIHAINYTAA